MSQLRTSRMLSLAAAAAIAAAAPNLASANPLHWDANGTSGVGGSGTWSSSAAFWRPDGTGTLQAWATEIAVFEGTGGTVSIDYNPAQLKKGTRFTADGYTLVGTGGNRTLTLEADSTIPSIGVTIAGSGLVTIGNTAANTAVNIAGSAASSAHLFSIDTGDTLHLVNQVSNMQLSKTGVGTLILSGANTYTSTTNITAGVLNIRNNTALGTTAGATIISSGASLEVQGGITVAENITAFSGTGISNGGALRNISGNNTLSGTITLTESPLDHRINSDAGVLTLSGSITEANGNSADKTLYLGGNGIINISGTINATNASDIGIVKDGSGTVTISGSNSMRSASIASGTLVVGHANALIGTVNVAGTLAIGTGVTYSRSTTFHSGSTLAGKGTFENGGTFTVGSGVVISPGINDVGTLSITDNVSFAAGSGLAVDIDMASETADALNVTGTVALNGTLYLNILNAEPGPLGSSKTFILIANDSTDAISGNFAVIGPAAEGMFQYTTTKTGGTGNDFAVTITSVPEPSAAAGLMLGATALLRRRRR